MSSQGLIIVCLAAVLTVASNLMLRAGVVRAGGFNPTSGTVFEALVQLTQQPLVLIGLAAYALAALVWFRVISTENLNTCYPILVGLTFTFVTLGATLFFREPVSWIKVMGLGMIFLGIAIVSRF